MTSELLGYAKTPGLPPGSAVYTGSHANAERAWLRVFDFDREHLHEAEHVTVDAVRKLADGNTVTWIDVVGLHDVERVQEVCRVFGIHSLTVEDILNASSRLKLEDFGPYVFVALKMLDVIEVEGRDHLDLATENLRIVLGEGFVLTFQEVARDGFDPVRRRIREALGQVRRRGCDYLAYALIDQVVDQYFVALDNLGGRVEELEDRVLEEVTHEQSWQIHAMRRELLHFRKAAYPLRDAVSLFHRVGDKLVEKGTLPFLRDLQDHVEQIVNTSDLYLELARNLVGLYQARLDHRMNEAMRVLSVIGTIFLPLTFLVGVYGMNFTHMPELTHPWGYPIFWGVTIATGVGLAWYFRRRGWM